MKKSMDSRRTFLSQNLSRAKNRRDGKEFDIDADYLFAIGEKQKWRCANSGVKMQFTRGGATYGGKSCNPYSCSIDRIDNTKGYVKGNVQLVTWAQNLSRGSMPLKEYKKLMGYKK